MCPELCLFVIRKLYGVINISDLISDLDWSSRVAVMLWGHSIVTVPVVVVPDTAVSRKSEIFPVTTDDK